MGHGTRKLTVSQDWTDGINWCFAEGTNSRKWFFKAHSDAVIFG